MDEHIYLLEEALSLLHRFLGYAHAKQDFKPILQFVGNPPTEPTQANKKPPDGTTDGEEAEKGIINFSSKEILTMPKAYQHYFRIDGVRVPYRKKKNGVYELRVTINKQKFYGASTSLKTAKSRFIENMRTRCTPQEPTKEAKMPETVSFQNYVLHFLETFKKPVICEKAYYNYIRISKKHIFPQIGEKNVTEITASDCQRVLNVIKEKGLGRTGEDVNSILRWTCSAALADGLLSVNPMTNTKILKHYRKNGKQIPAAAVREYLSQEPRESYDYLIRLLFFTGLRPAEIKSLTLDGEFFVVKNAKTPTGAPPTYRRIPIHTALKPYLDGIKANLTYSADVLSHKFHRRFPADYQLYDTRHTFTSRVQECGAGKSWVDYVTNHKGAMNVTDRVYTHWSDDFSILEIEKLRY